MQPKRDWRKYTGIVVITLFWIGVLSVLSGAIKCARAYDNTDNEETGERSGMELCIDHLTGCHYLCKPFGGITPRLDGDGKHVGCRED